MPNSIPSQSLNENTVSLFPKAEDDVPAPPPDTGKRPAREAGLRPSKGVQERLADGWLRAGAGGVWDRLRGVGRLRIGDERLVESVRLRLLHVHPRRVPDRLVVANVPPVVVDPCPPVPDYPLRPSHRLRHGHRFRRGDSE